MLVLFDPLDRYRFRTGFDSLIAHYKCHVPDSIEFYSQISSNKGPWNQLMGLTDIVFDQDNWLHYLRTHS